MHVDKLAVIYIHVDKLAVTARRLASICTVAQLVRLLHLNHRTIGLMTLIPARSPSVAFFAAVPD